MRNLFVNYYIAKDESRQKEIDICLQKNLESNLFDRVCIIVDRSTRLPAIFQSYQTKSIVQIITIDPIQPMFFDLFHLISNYSNDKDINVLSNADIIFDNTIDLCNNIRSENCYALSRWELNSDLSKNEEQVQVNNDSQDTWIFKGRVKNINTMYCDFPMGKMGCDNRIAFEINKAGYNILNPCKSVKTWHLHTSQFRGYTTQERNGDTVVPAPYLKIPLTFI